MIDPGVDSAVTFLVGLIRPNRHVFKVRLEPPVEERFDAAVKCRPVAFVRQAVVGVLAISV